MEYTKDVIFNVKYADTVERVEFGKKKWTDKIGQVVRQHKFISIILTMTTLLIGIDAVLMINFIQLFSKL